MEKHYYSTVQTLVNNNKLSYFTILRKKYPEIILFLIQKYPQLDGHPISEYCYWFLNNLTDFPKCANHTCNHSTSFISITLGYKQYCSRLCMQTDPLTEAKRIQTNLKRYHVAHAQQSRKVKEKCKRLRKQRIANDPNYLKNISNNVRNGLLAKAKLNQNYWKERHLKSQQTNIQNGHDLNWNNRKKAKQTIKKRIRNNKNYYSEIKQKAKATIQHYKEQDSLYYEKIAEKSRQTKIKNGHSANFVNPEKTKQTKLKLYHNPYYRNTEKCRQTCLKKYGVESFVYTNDFHKLRSKKYKNSLYPNLSFDSRWEFIVYDFCIKNSIPVEYQPNIQFEYSFDNKHHYYNPDFKIRNTFYEVKGDHFFNSDGKMFCPFRDKNWSDDQYKRVCQQFEAKHQCMLLHNVVILRNNEIHNLELYLK